MLYTVRVMAEGEGEEGRGLGRGGEKEIIAEHAGWPRSYYEVFMT